MFASWYSYREVYYLCTVHLKIFMHLQNVAIIIQFPVGHFLPGHLPFYTPPPRLRQPLGILRCSLFIEEMVCTRQQLIGQYHQSRVLPIIKITTCHTHSISSTNHAHKIHATPYPESAIRTSRAALVLVLIIKCGKIKTRTHIET